MASFSTYTPYICRSCIQNLSHRSLPFQSFQPLASTRQNPTITSSQHFSQVSTRSFKLTPVAQSTGEEIKSNDNNEYQVTPRKGGRIRPQRSSRRPHPPSSQPDELIPSEPSPPLKWARRITPQPKLPTQIWAPDHPSTYAKLKFSNLEDFNWYWETLPPTISQKAQSNHYFTKNAHPKFLLSAAFFRHFPDSDVPEVTFVGRSNVGKSSLLNAIVNADVKALLARTSSTPGFTKTMNLYGVGPGNGVVMASQASGGHDKIVGRGGMVIVDMPGYGEGSLSSWGVEIMKYIQNRKQLRRVFVLIDAQHGIKDKDRSLLASLRLAGVPHQIILSKLDKLYIPKAKEIKHYNGKALSKLKPKGSMEKLRGKMEEIRSEVQPPVGGGALGEILACSSEILVDGKRLGVDAVRFAMLQSIGFDFGPKRTSDLKQSENIVRTMKVG